MTTAVRNRLCVDQNHIINVDVVAVAITAAVALAHRANAAAVAAVMISGS